VSTQHFHCDECRKHHQHHSFCGCKGGFKNHDFGRHDHHFFDHQHHSCGCKGFKNHDFDQHDHRFFHHEHHLCGCKGFKDNDFRHDHHCLCDDRFRFRLSGLRSSMAFRLRQLMDCRVKIALEEDMIIHGKIMFVGNDFIEVVAVKKDKVKKEFKKKVILIQFHQIKWVERVKKF
jgi:hypothetical protein